MGATSYFELILVASVDTEEALGDFLFSEGALGLVTEDVATVPAAVRIRASFSGTALPDSLVERLRRYQKSLAALGFPVAECEITVREIPVEDWGRKWKEGFRPLPVGRRLLIVPPWEQGPFPSERKLVWIDPAMAFGTGHHATTRMCLEALEGFMDRWSGDRSPQVLDVGTGTGILAIAATVLGAARVIAMDTDPLACEAARKNLPLHGCAPSVRIVQGGTAALNRSSRFDLILANLDTRTLCPLFESLAMHLAIGGRLVVTGIPVEDETPVSSAIRSARLRIAETHGQDGWLCCTLELPPEMVKGEISLDFGESAMLSELKGGGS